MLSFTKLSGEPDGLARTLARSPHSGQVTGSMRGPIMGHSCDVRAVPLRAGGLPSIFAWPTEGAAGASIGPLLIRPRPCFATAALLLSPAATSPMSARERKIRHSSAISRSFAEAARSLTSWDRLIRRSICLRRYSSSVMAYLITSRCRVAIRHRARRHAAPNYSVPRVSNAAATPGRLAARAHKR
jgi:hypothetical protein